MREQEKITFIVNDSEVKLLKNIIIYEPYLQENIARIRRKDKDRYITFDAYDLFDVISALIFVMNHERSIRQKQELSEYIDRLKGYLSLVRRPDQKLGC